MTPPPVDALVTAGDAVPSLAGAALRVIGALAFLGGTAFALLRWRRGRGRAGSTLSVIDRAFLARGVSLAVVAVDDRKLLIGVSAEGVRLLTDLGAGPASRPFDEALDAARLDRERGLGLGREAER